MKITFLEINKNQNSMFNRVFRPWLTTRKNKESLTEEERIERRENDIEKYPKRYFLFSTIPFVVEDKYDDLKINVERILEKIRYRTTHRYHIINLGKPEYRCHSIQMLEASFTILKEFVEINLPSYRGIFTYLRKEWYLEDEHYLPPNATEEKRKEIIDYVNAKHEIALKLISLYLWWTAEYPAKQAGEISNFYPDAAMDHDMETLFQSKERKKKNGFYYVNVLYEELQTDNILEREQKEEAEIHQKLKELYEIWPDIFD